MTSFVDAAIPASQQELSAYLSGVTVLPVVLPQLTLVVN
jgi:hypothetical protein